MNLNHKTRVLKELFRLGKTPLQDASVHLNATIDWLCYAQDSTPDAGVSQTYLVKNQHWANSYPETTGYIIPTFYSYAALTGREDIRERARQMTEWECDIQTKSGGVLAGALGDCDKPTIFNTGQVLFGWARAFEEEKNERYRESAVKAANWLCDAQDDDGCWRRYGSPMTNNTVNTYNTRSAWGLLRVYQITQENKYLEAALKNIDWSLKQSFDNGWLPNNCLQDDKQPFVHTIAYAMRGFLEVGDYAKRDDFIKQAIKIGDALLTALPSNGMLSGRFDCNWHSTVKWSCLTGDAQIAINWGRLYQITGDEKYKEAMQKILKFVKSTQKLTGDIREQGGIKGSHPINGDYHPWQYPNWAAKFYADALMIECTIFNKLKTGQRFINDG
ncbi:conserved protein of unknown function [Methylotuvimicrobium alcaliphilum 20Z]|uniref:Squalene cyclase C-terminal domain-containing protein n=2 Tax=Methylotuvimicrobium alcaliphilum TaxID=271065 RepID=G4SYU7_META2|nr:conserved protein of unknown function [Methylotuvimicrobium alcaliphilum 20Z]